jgi:hypothetical protein
MMSTKGWTKLAILTRSDLSTLDQTALSLQMSDVVTIGSCGISYFKSCGRSGSLSCLKTLV